MAADLSSGISPTSGVDPLRGLKEVAEQLTTLAEVAWHEHAGAVAIEAIGMVEHASRVLTALQAQIVVAAEADGMWALDGHRTFKAWYTAQTGTTKSTASKAVELSKSLRDDLPRTRKALAQGEITNDHAQLISRKCTRTDKHRELLSDPECGEEFLVESAKNLDASQFAQVANTWATMTDPEAADRLWREASAKEEFVLAQTMDGWHLSGWLNPASGAVLAQAIRSHTGRKAVDDDRTLGQRQAGGLLSLAQQSLDAGFQMPSARIRPHLSITMGYDTIERLAHATGTMIPPAFGGDANGNSTMGAAEWIKNWKSGDDHVIDPNLDYSQLEGIRPATLSDGTPVPPSALSRFVCDSMLMRIVLGPEGTILDAGREKRIFPVHQTRAIIARDRHCQYPGCDQGPEFGEIHHSVAWAAHQGDTHVDLGILLCFHHHSLVHERNITITRRSGHWIFVSRHGARIQQSGHAPPGLAFPDHGLPRSAPRLLDPAPPDSAASTTGNDGGDPAGTTGQPPNEPDLFDTWAHPDISGACAQWEPPTPNTSSEPPF